MDFNTVTQYLLDHPVAVSATAASLVGTLSHRNLSRWPLAQVLAKYAGIYPLLRLAAVELAQAVLDQWGPQVEIPSTPKPVPDAPSPTPVSITVQPADRPVTFGEIAAKVASSKE